jgi:hypothetical protein
MDFHSIDSNPVYSLKMAHKTNFILAYPQAPLETPLYMEVPKGVNLQNLPRQPKEYVLELKKNLYGQKQAGRVWYV